MKADEPGSRVRADKYGMPASEAHHIVRRHFEVLDEDAALEGGRIAGDIEMSLALRGTRHPTVPTSAPNPATPAPVVVVSERARPDNLRTRLGLS